MGPRRSSCLATRLALRGLSWIVNAYDEGGVVIAIEITLGAAIAGPFAIDKAALEAMITRVMAPPVASGAVKIPINQKYPLKDAAKAHRDLESRATTGSSHTVLATLTAEVAVYPCLKATGGCDQRFRYTP